MKVRTSSEVHDDLAERTPFGRHLEPASLTRR
jgi:hypothetical protein